MSEYYTQVKPKMNDMDIQIRIDVIASKVIVGTQLNVDDLSKQRHFLRFRNAVTLKTNLAYSMIRLSNIKYGDLVVDVSFLLVYILCLLERSSQVSLLLSYCNNTSIALLWKWYHLIGSIRCV